MHQLLKTECDVFCNRFPHQMALAEKIWEANCSGKYWGRDGAIAFSLSMCRTIGGVDELTQVLDSHYSAFGHAAKRFLGGRVWYIWRAIFAIHDMLYATKVLQHIHEVKPLSLENLQVLVAAYNRAGKFYKKIGWDEKSYDFFVKAFDLAKANLVNVRASRINDPSILLYADMISNPLIDVTQRRTLTAACSFYAFFHGGSLTVKIRCFRAVGKHDQALKMENEL